MNHTEKTGKGVAADERKRMIAVAAYYKAEQRAFAAGEELSDWLAAEREIDRLLLGAPAVTTESILRQPARARTAGSSSAASAKAAKPKRRLPATR